MTDKTKKQSSYDRVSHMRRMIFNYVQDVFKQNEELEQKIYLAFTRQTTYIIQCEHETINIEFYETKEGVLTEEQAQRVNKLKKMGRTILIMGNFRDFKLFFDHLKNELLNIRVKSIYEKQDTI